MGRKIAGAIAIMSLGCGGDRDSEPPPTQGGERPVATDVDQRRVVLFLGTSLTAGLGVSESESFPAVIQSKIDSLGVPLRVVNAGESGGTSAGGLRRIGFLLEEYTVEVLVLELGANDGLRGLDIEDMRSNLDEIIERTRDMYPSVQVIVAGMEAPPNLGEPYTRAFREVYEGVATAHAARLIPFLLEGVAAIPPMNQADGIHPNVAGHRRVAENVWLVLREILQSYAVSGAVTSQP